MGQLKEHPLMNHQAQHYLAQASLTPPLIDGVDNKLEILINMNSEEKLRRGLQDMRDSCPSSQHISIPTAIDPTITTNNIEWDQSITTSHCSSHISL